MAISPPSDIVLDVANAASRTDIETARTKLLARIADRKPVDDGAGFATPAEARTAPAPAPASKNPYVKFEAMVLQNFVKSMLPEDAQSVYGSGLSGDMWKSMLAEKIGETIAERGGIGIADRMLPDHYREGKRIVPLSGVSRGAERDAADEQANLATGLVEKLQRSTLLSLQDDERRTGVTATAARDRT